MANKEKSLEWIGIVNIGVKVLENESCWQTKSGHFYLDGNSVKRRNNFSGKYQDII